MRRFQQILFIILLTSLFWGCEQGKRRSANLLDYIPANSENVIKIANLETTRNDLTGTHLFKQLNETGLYDLFKSEDSVLTRLTTQGESILCFQKSSDSTQNIALIARSSNVRLVVDSLSATPSEKKNYKGYEIVQTGEGGILNFSATVDSMFIATSTEVLLKDIIDDKTEKDPLFKKAFSLKTKDGLVSITSPNALHINDSVSINFGSRAALELEIFPDGVNARGVLLHQDSLPQLVSIFKGLLPQQHTSEFIIPAEAISARSFTYNDVDRLAQNLQHFHKDSTQLAPIFGSVNEITGIQLPEGKAVALKSIDADITNDEFKRYTVEGEFFREVQLYGFVEDTLSFAPFFPLIDPVNASVAFELEQFFVFAQNEEVAQKIISSSKNNATLGNTSYFENTSAQMSQSSSFVVYNMQGVLSPWITTFLGASESKVEKFPLAVLQLSYDRDFAHVNLVCKEVSETKQSSGLVTQLFSRKLDAAIMGAPQFFSNHRTRGKDVVVQDISNQLYLLSAGGKVLWKKKLDGAILGEIQEVDLLRNGKKQLAFVTPNTFYIIDRNGNSVAPFPKKYKDKITQPLSIFDYDNRRNYRFVISQGNKVFMYDSKGKTVSGFTFKQTQSNIVLPPQHIRMGNKDYLLIAEENGKLNILSRIGKERVKVNKKFKFSEMPIAREGLNFVFITAENTKESISQTGKVTSKSLNVAENYWFEILGNTKVTLDDNLLRINGKLVELPFGVYSKPRVTVSNRKTYVLITELQEKKVYLMDKEGTLVKGFPIYGSSVPALGDARNNRKNAIVVKGNEDEVILYTIE